MTDPDVPGPSDPYLREHLHWYDLLTSKLWQKTLIALISVGLKVTVNFTENTIAELAVIIILCNYIT